MIGAFLSHRIHAPCMRGPRYGTPCTGKSHEGEGVRQRVQGPTHRDKVYSLGRCVRNFVDARYMVHIGGSLTRGSSRCQIRERSGEGSA